ncbi:DUF4222 domain-containing protein [Scandinavium goeteborgense]|uniref:DUF4222 domain-containing protein n=1 Tax=Scandinavium goeteborgense TaxID=1851514 RepID=UPI000F66EB5B|nr:DUF4222 domain-containing protein [Scandinavium goeteborgense]
MHNTHELVTRMKNAMQFRLLAEPEDLRTEPFPGSLYRDERGCLVKVIRCSRLHVVYHREGYRDALEMARREFSLTFTEVSS